MAAVFKTRGDFQCHLETLGLELQKLVAFFLGLFLRDFLLPLRDEHATNL